MDDYLSVGSLVGLIKNSLESSYQNLVVEGEITNLSFSGSGHWYFSLRDQNAVLSAALFKMDAYRNPLIKTLKDGDKIRCHGSISVYGKRGTFQLIVKRLMAVGKGQLKEKFEKLKRKLSSEGLFDLENKKRIPLYSKRVAVITARNGAALQDFLAIQKRKSLWMDTVIIPAIVQGDAAPMSLRKSLHQAIAYSQGNPHAKFDIIVITRGGGSLEDLWAFNDEGLAYDIYNSPIPVISGVGHEVDFSICDFVSDLRVETPSAAAEVITKPQEDIMQRMTTSRKNLLNLSDLYMQRRKNYLKNLTPKVILEKIYSNLLFYQKKIEMLNPSAKPYQYTKIHEYSMAMDDLDSRMKFLLKSFSRDHTTVLEKTNIKLNLMNPKTILKRGYTYIEDEDKHVVSDIQTFKNIDSNKKLTLNFYDGKAVVIK